MSDVEVIYNFMQTTSHLKEIGAITAICGAPVVGWFARRFFFITQVGCKECVNELSKRRK